MSYPQSSLTGESKAELLEPLVALGERESGECGIEGEEEIQELEGVDSSHTKYGVDGTPDYYSFLKKEHKDLASLGVTQCENDLYLADVKPVEFYGASMTYLGRGSKYAKYKRVSGYTKKDNDYSLFVQEHRPYAARVEGGKGVTHYSRSVVYTTGGMSLINNFSITMGCSSNCSFCKESLLARGYTQVDFLERTGTILLSLPEGRREVLGKSKVKFYDTNLQKVMIAPIQVALRNKFPVCKDSLVKLLKGSLTRFMQD
jgi:hypothetical protein